MRQIILGVSLFLSVLVGCKGQVTDKTGSNKLDTINKIEPKTNIKVNKEYDENGNLIRYDSTYSYYYSNIEGDSLLRDSVFNKFRNFFHEEYNFSDEPFFNNLFFQDSLLKYDFYNNDFFIKRFKNNQMQMNDFFLQMDSLKNRFFEYQFSQPNK